MKKNNLYMFLILQLLLVLSNYSRVDTTIFNIELIDILMIIISVFSFLYILFISKVNLIKKSVYLLEILLCFITFIVDKSLVKELITNIYILSSFSFLLYYYINGIDKFKIIIISYISLIVVNISTIFIDTSIILELIIVLLLVLSLSFSNFYKKISLFIFLITVIVAYFNNMNFVLYNSLIISLIILISSKNKKDFSYNILFLIISFIFSLLINLFTIDKLFNTFEVFEININLLTIIVGIFIILYICNLITKFLLNKTFKLEEKLYTYTLILFITLMILSFNNINNVFVILILSYLGILFIDNLNNYNKKIKKEITFFVLHLGYGGIESSTINTCNELSKYYNVKIISFYDLKRNIENTIDKKIKIIHLYNGEPNKEELIESIKNKNISGIIKNGFKAFKILFLKEYLNVKNMYYSNSKYLISTRNEYSILLSEFGNVKSTKIAIEHQHHRDNKKYIDNIKYKFNNIDYLFALTPSLKKDYIRFLKNNKKTKVKVIPNIVNIPNKKSKLDSKNLITVSRLHDIKKIDEMITIFSKIKEKESILYIVGDGEDKEKLEHLTKKLKLEKRVKFTGYKTKEEMEEYFLKSSIFLMTSISEGLPMVLLESLSYGVPCICYKTKSGVCDIIDDNSNGYIIDNRNQDEFIKKVDYLLSNKKTLEKFSKNGLKKVNLYTSDKVIEMWKEVLENEKG